MTSEKIPFVLQARDFAFLCTLIECRALTANHAAILHFGGSKEATKKRLQKLKAAGLIAERKRRASEPAVLSLASKAFPLLKARGLLESYPKLALTSLVRRSKVSPITLAHELEVMDVKSAFHLAMTGIERFSIAEFTTWPLLHQFEAERAGNLRQSVIVKPDGFKTPLKNEYGDKQFYQKRLLIGELFPDCNFFEEQGLGILPTDIVNAIYRAKLLFASQDEDSFLQRSGEGSEAFGIWSNKPAKYAEALECFFEWMKDSIEERTLLTQLSSFIGPSKSVSNLGHEAVESFFEQLFKKLGASFVAFVNADGLMAKYKQMQPNLREHTPKHCQEYFYAPSIGFTVTGSPSYCYQYSTAWLRTFLHLLRIAGFVGAPQIDSHDNASFLPPKGPVWLGSRSIASYSWSEAAFESWRKSPDGNLFLSFGYRRLSNIWLDDRTFRRFEAFILDKRKILESMKHPWGEKPLRDVIPTLDLLNTVTQLPDEGAKLLLLCCCLEHLFVPPSFTRDNKKYIVGGINALRPDLMKWFEELYKRRCEYAHKGFLPLGEQTRGLMVESVQHVLSLVNAKLGNS